MQLPERVSLPLPLEEFSEIIDVRSPSEFAEDHIPGAINLPVLSDEERHEVGLINASNAFESRRLGATLVTKNIHRHLAETLADRPREYAPLIYCWRGNMRSNSTATILRAIGWRARVIQGGYKAWRKWLMADLDEQISKPQPELIVLAGLTGCGKTRLLHALKEQGAQVLDLEGHAHHKGSILGNPANGSQPAQKLFETSLWHDFSNFDHSRPVFTEAESNRIGKLQLPGSLWRRLGMARVALVSLPLAERAKFLAADYPHFVEDPQRLKDTLDGLRRLRGHAQIDQWHAQIDQADWTTFLESILLNHYDVVYRKPGSEDSIYQAPEDHLHLEKFTESTFTDGAAELIKRFSQ